MVALQVVEGEIEGNVVTIEEDYRQIAHVTGKLFLTTVRVQFGIEIKEQ